MAEKFSRLSFWHGEADYTGLITPARVRSEQDGEDLFAVRD